MEQQNNNNIQPAAVQEESIDWQLYISKVWKGRKTIIIATFLSAVLGVVIALSTPRKYTTTVTLAPELGKNGSTSSLSGIASMLGMGGMQTGNTADAYNVTNYPDIVASTPFITSLFDIRVQDPDEKIDTTLIGYLTRKNGKSLFEMIGLGGKKEKEKEKTTVDIFKLTKKQYNVFLALNKMIATDVDKKTGVTTINVTTDNPYVSAIVADSVCTKLRRYIIDYRTSKAREDLEYYQKLADESYASYKKATNAYAYYQDHNRGLILNAVISEGSRLQNEASITTQVYTQMKQQAEMARGKVQEEKPVFAVIQPASVPVRPVGGRSKIALMWMMLGFAGSVAWVLFGPEYLGKAKEMLAAARKEEEV